MPTPTGPNAPIVTNDAHRVAVEIDVSEIGGRLERESMRLIKEGIGRGLTGDKLADFVEEGLRGLSDAPITRASRSAASEAFNLGKNLEVQRRPDEIAAVVRSEILDTETCDPCFALDGVVVQVNGPVVEASDRALAIMAEMGIDPSSDSAYQALMPPTACDGREYCRGFYYARAA